MGAKLTNRQLKYLLFILFLLLVTGILSLVGLTLFFVNYPDDASPLQYRQVSLLTERSSRPMDKVHPDIVREIQKNDKKGVSVVVMTEEEDSSPGKKSRKIRKVVSTRMNADEIDDAAYDGKTVGIYPNRKYYALSGPGPVVSISGLDNGGSGVRIAVLDTGMNKGSFNIAEEAVFTGEDHATDAFDHGTRTAEIITAIAPGSLILNAKVLSDTGEGLTTQVIQGILWSIENNANIIVMSFGNPDSDLDVPLEAAISHAVSKGISVVVAAGNCGETCPAGSCGGYVGVTSPGSLPDVITVGSLDEHGEIACYSSRSDTKPDIYSPYTEGQTGTSVSAAYAAGVAALFVKAYPDNSPEQIKQLLLEHGTEQGQDHADDLSGQDTIGPSPDDTLAEPSDETEQDYVLHDDNNSLVYTPMSAEDPGYYYFEYDNNGNLVSALGNYYEYDSLNQLVRVRAGSAEGSVLEEYFYDEEGSRVKKVEYDEDGSARTDYYINDNLVRSVDSSGISDTVYFYQGSLLVGRKDSDGSRFYYHPNHLGSTDIVTDENGDIVERTEYMPFGTVLSGGDDRFLFTGKELDSTGLMYYGARYYDPFLRRFTQPDTMLPDVYDPQQLNRYAYARNNPMKYVDESGHFINVPFLGYIIFDSTIAYLFTTGALIGTLFGIVSDSSNSMIYEFPPVNQGTTYDFPGSNYNGEGEYKTPSVPNGDLPYLIPGIESGSQIDLPTIPTNQDLQLEAGRINDLFNRLPYEGDFTYKSPKHYHNLDEIYNKNGFLDAYGNRWKWHVKSNHWDVTHPKTGRHANGNPDGSVTDGDIPKEFKR